jgi:carbonic anhydrase
VSQRDGPPGTAPGSEYERILSAHPHDATQLDLSGLPAAPRRRLAVIACMDSRLNVEDALGLRQGDAHVIRNAGGLATDDAIRSLVISQELLGTEEVIVVEHTGCRMLTFQDADIHRALVERTGADLDVTFHAFPDLESNLRAQVEQIRAHPWIRDVPVHGLVYELESGRFRAVEH